MGFVSREVGDHTFGHRLVLAREKLTHQHPESFFAVGEGRTCCSMMKTKCSMYIIVHTDLSWDF